MLHLILKSIRAVHRAQGVVIWISLVTTILLSCQKETPPTDFSNPSHQRTTPKNLLAKFPPQNQRLIYNLLTPTEKSDLWAYHLVDAKKQLNIDKAQNEFLESVIEKLTPVFFEQSLEHISTILDNLQQRAISLFTKETYTYLFFTLDNSYQDFSTAYNSESVLVNPDTDPPKLPDCKCSTKSDFCSGILKCTATDECKTTSAGCGFFFFYSCSGNCK
jgi:hypothetical protein